MSNRMRRDDKSMYYIAFAFQSSFSLTLNSKKQCVVLTFELLEDYKHIGITQDNRMVKKK